MNRSDLKRQFKDEKGISWKNSQGEPDIDYVEWLEAKVIAVQKDAIKSVCNHPYDSLHQDEYGFNCEKCGMKLTD